MKTPLRWKITKTLCHINLYLFRLCIRYMTWAGFTCSDLVDDMEYFYRKRKCREEADSLARYWGD